MEQQNNATRVDLFVENEGSLTKLKEDLKRAEDSLEGDEFEDAIAEYMTLAEMFMERYKNYHVSAYLYKKCMELAKEINVRKKFLNFSFF